MCVHLFAFLRHFIGLVVVLLQVAASFFLSFPPKSRLCLLTCIDNGQCCYNKAEDGGSITIAGVEVLKARLSREKNDPVKARYFI